jgi:hypothetical protein
MITRILIFVLVFFQYDALAQADSVWNVMILKKGSQPEMKDNMAEYSHTGFYLYRNCFYDLKFTDKTQRTLRLIDIKPDTLVFIGISSKKDSDFTKVSKDTFLINYRSIDQLLLIKDWGAKNSRKIKCADLYFVFHKSDIDNRYESKYAQVFPDGDLKSELVPRLSSDGITYHYEYGGRLYHYSAFTVQSTRYSEEQKAKALKGVLTVLDLIVNKRLIVTIPKNNPKKDE